MSAEIRLLVARGGSLPPETLLRCAAELSPAERAAFARMADPLAADVRTVLRATANRLRSQGEVVSVAHAGRLGVLVHAKARIGESFALGVDCEAWDGETPSPELVRDVASPEEFSRWSALPGAERRRAFVRLWTLKEAAFKAGFGSMRDIPVAAGFFKTDAPGSVSMFVEAAPELAIAIVSSAGEGVCASPAISRAGSF